MKLLMTTDTVGGVWTYAMELIRALQCRPCTVALATMGAPLSAAQEAEVRALPNVTVYESSYRLEWMAEPWADVAAAGRWLLALEQRVRPDLIHLNNYVHGALPWQAPRLVVGHSCVLSWWEAVKGVAAPAEWQRYQRLVRAGLRQADQVVAPSQAMLHALRHHYGPFAADRVIYNGRDGTTFSASAKEPFVLTVGRLWDEAKNLQLLAAAAPQLQWPIYSAGAAVEPTGTTNGLGMTAGLLGKTPGAIQPLGFLAPTQVAAWMGRAAIYALPARYEPFGLSVLEAALAHCALVLGNIPSLREIWGDAAQWVDPTDEQGLVDTITALIAAPAERTALGQRAYQRAQRYQTAKMGAAYWQLYQRLLAARRRPIYRFHPQPNAVRQRPGA